VVTGPATPRRDVSDSPSYTDLLLRSVRDAGADRVGVTSAAPLTRAKAALEARVAAGFADDMQFTFRNPDRSTTPTMSVPGARSIIVAARSYWSDGQHDAATGDRIDARVARYAWRDHYEPLRDALRVAARRLKRDGHRATVFADDNSVVDREVAWRAGLGWYGKNANLLLEGLGSWFVLGCVVTTAELEVTERDVAPGVVDARKCLGWLIQKPGTFDPAHRAALGTRIYGCDDCQEVCPPSRRGAIDRSHPDERATVDALELLTVRDDAVLGLVGSWYVADRNPRWVRRNALIVLGNSGVVNDDVVSVLARYLHGDDPLLREHAQWAARRLGIAAGVTEDLLP